MAVKLHGIVQRFDGVDKYVDVIVTKDHGDMYTKHHMGKNVNVNRGQVRKFVAGVYGVEPGSIVWPHHIKAENI